MGFGIEGDIAKIYNNYINKHPECSVLSPDAVYLRMKEEGVITQEQYNTIKKGLIFDFKSQKSETDGDWKSTFGLQTTQSKKPNSVKQNIAGQKTYHPVYKDLLLDSKGKIDMNQFSLNTINKKYPKDKFVIKNTKTKDDYGYDLLDIEITDKKGNKILDLRFYDGNVYQTSYKNGKEYNFYQIKNGVVTTGRHTESNGNNIQYDYEDDGKTIKRKITGDNNGYTRRTYKNGELSEINIVDYNKNTEITKQYIHGVLASEYSYDKGSLNHIISMMEHISTPNIYGYHVVNSQNAQNLIKCLDQNNIREFLSDYEEKYGKSFFGKLYKGHDNKNKDQEKLISHIAKLLNQSSSYNLNKKVQNDQVKNDNYTSKNIYDVQYNGKKVFINNKTTGKKSTLDFDKLLTNIKNPIEKVIHIENMQKLPAEILEIYANEGITLRGHEELSTSNIDEVRNGRMKAGGFYSSDETITLPFYTDQSTYIHEVFHALDFDKFYNAESETQKLKDAFELGLKRYEAAGYRRHYLETAKNTDNMEDNYYFSTDANECWARIGEMLFYGECESQDILKQFWPEFIELEKQAIAKIQSKPANERHS